jgi:FAD/FMN-containing dehydrogenase
MSQLSPMSQSSAMKKLSRRGVLAIAGVGGVAAIAAGCTPKPASRPSAAATSTPSTAPTGTVSPVTAADWTALAASIAGHLARPGDANYNRVRVTENPRWDTARPVAVLTAARKEDVAAALAFATRHGIPLALRAGGHSYPGYSAGGAPGTGVAPSLVVDARGLKDIEFLADNEVRIGAGVALARVYAAVGARGRAIAGGSCATVGVTGLTLGGGVGVLVRNYGLTCDSLREIEIVTADGVVHTANPKSDADLFWACRGGGGGHLGVVTALTFSTSPAPLVTMFALSWPFSAARHVIAAWQKWAPTADRRLWSTLKILGGPKYTTGPMVFLSGTWLGPSGELPAKFASFLAQAGKPATNLSGVHAYADAMARYAGCGGVPVSQCTTGPGGKLSRESFAATSHIAYKPLDSKGIDRIIEQIGSITSIAGVREAGISIDALGGAVSTVAPDATAFPHRAAIASVQYTCTFPDGEDPAPFDKFVRGFRAAMVPSWGKGAYVNYADGSLADPATSYFAGNATRLAAIRRKYDPTGVFTQPQAF